MNASVKINSKVAEVVRECACVCVCVCGHACVFMPTNAMCYK